MNEEAKIQFLKDCLTTLAQYGITKKDVDQMEKEVKKKWGDVPETDIIDRLFQTAKLRIMKKAQDYNELSEIHFDHARFRNTLGKESFQILQEAYRMQLLGMKRLGYTKKVRIYAGNDACEVCKKQHGSEMTIEQALKTMPLPCKNCTTKIYNDNVGWCRCYYEEIYGEDI